MTKRSDLNISFEIFPARSEDAERQLSRTLDDLMPLEPNFVSVTYGAGGSTRDRTLTTLQRVRRQHSVPLTGHLTAIGQTRDETDAVVSQYRAMGLRRIVALRGDVPPGSDDTGSNGYANAHDLINGIRRQERGHPPLHISVAAYPDAHPASANKSADLDNLVAKFDAGADAAISQFFFMNAPFLRLRDKLAKRGINKPLVAGILPVTNFAQTLRMARRCKTRMPRYVSRGFKHVSDDAEMTRLFAISLAVEQIDNLIAEGVRDFHFYTMNRSDMTQAIAQLIGREHQEEKTETPSNVHVLHRAVG